MHGNNIHAIKSEKNREISWILGIIRFCLRYRSNWPLLSSFSASLLIETEEYKGDVGFNDNNEKGENIENRERTGCTEGSSVKHKIV